MFLTHTSTDFVFGEHANNHHSYRNDAESTDQQHDPFTPESQQYNDVVDEGELQQALEDLHKSAQVAHQWEAERAAWETIAEFDRVRLVRLHIEACMVEVIPAYQLSSFLPTPIGGNEANYNDYSASLEQLVHAFYDYLRTTDECADVRDRVNQWLIELRSSSTQAPVGFDGADDCGLSSFREGAVGHLCDGASLAESLFQELK